MESQENIHDWFTDQIPAELTAGFDDESRHRFTTHASECPQCNEKWTQARRQDSSLKEMFAHEIPAAGFEDRIIQHLRADAAQHPSPLRLPRAKAHPTVRRAAWAAAAAIMLAGLGYEATKVIEGGKAQIVQCQTNLKMVGAATFMYTDSNETAMALLSTNSPIQLAESNSNNHDKVGQQVLLNDSILLPTDDNAGESEAGKFPTVDSNDTKGSFLRTKDLSQQAGQSEASRQAISSYTYDTTIAPQASKADYFKISPTNTIQESDRDAGTLTMDLPVLKATAGGFATSGNGSLTFQGGLAPAGSQGFDVPTVAAGGTLVITNALPLGNQRIATPTGGDPAPSQTVAPGAAAPAQTEAANFAKSDQTMDAEQKAQLQKLDAADKAAILADAGNKQSPVPTPTPTAAPTAAPVQTPAPDASRKIIRHGDLTFEVENFDSAFAQITKIATEEGGFIATANSDKLANGKVSGLVDVRVPPDHLDIFVLKLRALGDLKGQKIASDDITKEYTDLQSELRAAQAMEDRLLDIIKTGNGEVKDLVEAEKELGSWREKVEKVTGDINYYNNLISFSTLHINLMERDIRQASLATEQEKINLGLETDDVEKARADALKSIDDAKGRIIQSDLKKFDAGQMAATIVAEVSPASAGPVTDRLKQLGRVARLDITRQQTVPDGTTVPAGVKVELKDTQLQISLYNLANIAPRESTNLSLACDDVETAYHAILARITAAGGRVVNSTLNRVKPDQIDGTINCESPDEKADSVLLDIRAQGQIMHLAVAENPDAANVTSAKRGFAITLVSSTSVAPRESITISLMPAGNVTDAYREILTAAQAAGADVKAAQLEEQNTHSASATIVIDVPRKQQTQIEDAIRDATKSTGQIVSRQSNRSEDTEHTLDTKVQFSLTLASSEAIAPRDTIGRVLAVTNVPDAYNAILAAAQSANAKVVTAQIDQSRLPNVTAQLDIIVPRDGLDAVEKSITDAKADIVSKSVNRAADASNSTDEKTSLRLRIVNRDQLPPRQTTTATVQVSDPESAMADLKASALSAAGHVISETLTKDDRFIAHLVIDVPLAKGPDILNQAGAKGSVTSIEQSLDPAMSDATFARARLDLTLAGESNLVNQNSGIWATFKSGLSTSITGLMYSLQLIVIGLCLVIPWAILIWVGWKGWKRLRRPDLSQPIHD